MKYGIVWLSQLTFFIIIYKCISVCPPFQSHSSASMKYWHIQIWLTPLSDISLPLLCPAHPFFLPVWVCTSSVSSSFILQILSSLSQPPLKGRPRTKKILLLQPHCDHFHTPFHCKNLLLSWHGNFVLLPIFRNGSYWGIVIVEGIYRTYMQYTSLSQAYTNWSFQ